MSHMDDVRIAGYQWVVGAVFLLMFPLSILLRTSASAASQVILSQRLGNPPLQNILDHYLQLHLEVLVGMLLICFLLASQAVSL